jgi:protein-L-isoaspartate(D-aspartate) O-methyltransferase
MTRDDSETTFTEKRLRMVERQLHARGITDERVLAAMAEVPRHRFVPENLRRRAYRDGALRIGEGQTISQPWIVACMAQLLELEGDETVLEVGTGSGYAAAVLSRLCADLITIERLPTLARQAAETLAGLGYENVEVRVGDGSRGAPDRAPFGGISVTATAEDEPPPALVAQLAPGAALVCPIARGRSDQLVRVRGGDEVLALPKGHPDAGESAADAAWREVREETGLEAELVEKLDDIRYWYVRGGERVMKIVSFFLFRYRRGRVADHDHEVQEALWIPLDEAPDRLAYKGEREMATIALSRVTPGG